MADRKQRSTQTAQQAATNRPGSLLDAVRLDLARAVPTDPGHGRVTVRVEGLLNGARLTKGQNNGDRTWSLNIDELADLKYVPPYGGFIAHTLWIRVLALDDGFANTLRVFALEVDPDDLPPRLPEAEANSEPAKTPAPKSAARGTAATPAPASDISTVVAQIEAEAERMLADAEKKQAAQTARQLKEARAAWQKETDGKIAEAKAVWQKEAERKLAEAQETWKKRAAQMAAEAKSETEAAMLQRIKMESGANAADQAAQAQKQAELEKRLRAAESKVGAAEKGSRSATAAIADLQSQMKGTEKALDAAEKKAAAAEAETGKLATALSDLQAQSKDAAKLLEKAEARALAAEKATQAADAKLVDAMAKLARADEAVKKAAKNAEAGAEDQVKALQADFAAREEAHEAALEKAREDTRNAVDAEYVQALDALRGQHEQELTQRIAQERETLAREFEGRMAEMQAELEKAAESRVGAVENGIENAIAEACATAVAEARADWERENERNLAQASEAWKRDQDQRIAAARVEWESEHLEAIETARAEWLNEQETALAAAAAEARASQDAALAEKDSYWQEELERRLSTARSETSDDVVRRLEAERAEWDRSHEAALIERDDAWRDHIEQKLKEARQQWQIEEEARLAAAREDWQKTFGRQAGQSEMPADRSDSGKRPADAAASDDFPMLNLQDKLPPSEATPGPSRSGGRRNGFVSRLMRSIHRNTIGRLPMKLIVRGTAVAGLAAVGYYAYPHVTPVFVDKIAPMTTNMAAKVQGIGERLFTPTKEEPVSPLIGRRFFIRPSSANLRMTPTPNADVVDIIERATVVEILAVNGNWMQVRTIGRSVKQGWIHRTLLAERPFG